MVLGLLASFRERRRGFDFPLRKKLEYSQIREEVDIEIFSVVVSETLSLSRESTTLDVPMLMLIAR